MVDPHTIALDYDPEYVDEESIQAALKLSGGNLGRVRILCAIASNRKYPLADLIKEYFK